MIVVIQLGVKNHINGPKRRVCRSRGLLRMFFLKQLKARVADDISSLYQNNYKELSLFLLLILPRISTNSRFKFESQRHKIVM